MVIINNKPSMALLAFLLIFSFSTTISPATAQQDVYIVHVNKPDVDSVSMQSEQALRTWYHSFLPSDDDVAEPENRIIYSYKNVVTGFAARLTAEEMEAMSHKDGFLYAHKQRILSLHTTHTPNFLGLHQNMGFLKGSNFGKGVIVGVLDTGILPTHPSFDDHGMSPPPAKWKGRCDFDAGVCNNKLIGARNFLRGGSTDDEPSDGEGHGTHTASTAVGAFVKGAAALGNAKGTAVGMAPLAHLAIYKVCGDAGCADSDILGAMDEAVEDGVDVLSLSLGGGSLPFFRDATALGGFGAIQKGVFVSCSAGNNGPEYESLSNEAPWILTVGASTVDRKIKASAKLGNGAEYAGESLFQPSDFASTLLPLVYAGGNGNETSGFCAPGSLTNMNVQGKVVVCDRGGEISRIAKGQEVKDAGGAAMILANDVDSGYTTLADAHVLPATNIDYLSGIKIKSYINSTSSPTATILFQGTIIGDSSAPAVASFSSRGPSLQSPGILKPDIVGPGVSILAAWPFPLENTTTLPELTFNVISGTSMSCPHLSGIAALLKSSHPDWSPAAIKSAIMTTADSLNLGGNPIVDQTLNKADIFATGAGQVNPTKANEPGLVYDTQPDDYIPYLCGLGYKDSDISVIFQRTVTCANVTKIPEAQLNYPTFSIILGNSTQTFTRTVTNVGDATSSYTVDISAPLGVEVGVSPSTIQFTAVGQTATYTVSFSVVNPPSEPFSQGYLRWVYGVISVKSPITVIFA